MNDVPADLPGLLTALMAGSGVFFGLVSVWVIDRVVALWEARTGAPVSGTKKRWISIGVPATLVLLGYAGLLLLGTVPFTQQTAYLAAVNALAAAGSKQALYAAIQSADKPQVVTSTTNIQSVTSDRDLYLGGTTYTATQSEGGRYMDVTKETPP